MLQVNELVRLKRVESYKGKIEDEYVQENKFTFVGVDRGQLVVKTMDNKNLFSFVIGEMEMANGDKLEVELHTKMDKLELVDNEVDIRGLTNKDYKQLMWRCELTKQGYLKQSHITLLEVDILLRALCEKMGIDAEALIDEKFTPKDKQ